MLEIKPDQFLEARKVIQGKALVSPLIPFESKNNKFPIFLKAECLQPGGSFKIRGATYTLSKVSAKEHDSGAIAYSTGNHAQAVAIAARSLGMPSLIVMSPDAMPFKVEATKAFGAEVKVVPLADRRPYAETLAKDKGAVLVPPYDHPDVITGQGTIGLEILDVVEPAAIFVPVGGGGLIAGIAVAVKQKYPHVKIIGVEPKLENDATESFKTKKLVGGKGNSQTIADAVKISELGQYTFPLVLRYVDDMIAVSEQQIAQATLDILNKTHLIAEPAGALSLAGALAYPFPLAANKPVVCVTSGGNTTIELLASLKNLL